MAVCEQRIKKVFLKVYKNLMISISPNTMRTLDVHSASLQNTKIIIINNTCWNFMKISEFLLNEISILKQTEMK